MTYMSAFVAAPSDAGLALRRGFPGPAQTTEAERDAPPFWTPARIDLARRMWSKGTDEADIVVALRRLPGPVEMTAQAIAALAHRLCWPGPKQAARPDALVSRDGLPSMAERQAAELARTLDTVDLPLDDALAWGRANGIVRLKTDTDADLLVRINRARAGYSLPRFRVSRRP